MVRTSEYVRLRLFSFFRANFKISTAIRELSRTDGIKVSRKTVRKYYKCFRQNPAIGDLPRSGRQTKGDTHTNAQTGPKNIWEIHLATASRPQAIQESIFPKMLTYYSKVNEVFWLKLMRE